MTNKEDVVAWDGWHKLTFGYKLDALKDARVSGFKLSGLVSDIPKYQQLFDCENDHGKVITGCRLFSKGKGYSYEVESRDGSDWYGPESGYTYLFGIYARTAQGPVVMIGGTGNALKSPEQWNVYRIRISTVASPAARDMWRKQLIRAETRRLDIKRRIVETDAEMSIFKVKNQVEQAYQSYTEALYRGGPLGVLKNKLDSVGREIKAIHNGPSRQMGKRYEDLIEEARQLNEAVAAEQQRTDKVVKKYNDLSHQQEPMWKRRNVLESELRDHCDEKV